MFKTILIAALSVLVPASAIIAYGVGYDYGYEEGVFDSTTRKFRCDGVTVTIENFNGQFPPMDCKEWVALPN